MALSSIQSFLISCGACFVPHLTGILPFLSYWVSTLRFGWIDLFSGVLGNYMALTGLIPIVLVLPVSGTSLAMGISLQVFHSGS